MSPIKKFDMNFFIGDILRRGKKNIFLPKMSHSMSCHCVDHLNKEKLYLIRWDAVMRGWRFVEISEPEEREKCYSFMSLDDGPNSLSNALILDLVKERLIKNQERAMKERSDLIENLWKKSFTTEIINKDSQKEL